MAEPVTGMLAGIRVLDQGNFITGPCAAQLLADMGADVIKIERPGTGDPFRAYDGGLYSAPFQAYNRNKRSLAVDLDVAADRELFEGLVRTADVYIQNFRPSVARKIGVDAARLTDLNPRLVYCAISGFGPDGPYATRPSYDTVAQALSGYLGMFVDPSDPRIVGPAVADAVTGFYAAQGILAALLHRRTTGVGHRVEVSMLGAMAHFSSEPYANFFRDGRVPGPCGRAAVSQSYAARCSDGRMLAIHLSSPEKFWTGLLDALERPDLAADPRFRTRADRVAHHDALRVALQAVFAHRSRDAWLERLIERDVPCAPVHELGEALDDPQAKHLGLDVAADHPAQGRIRSIRFPVRFDGREDAPCAAPPMLGEHRPELEHELATAR